VIDKRGALRSFNERSLFFVAKSRAPRLTFWSALSPKAERDGPAQDPLSIRGVDGVFELSV